MSRLSISSAWEQTKAILARDGKLITNVALALVVLPVAIGALVAPPPTLSDSDPVAPMPLLNLVVAIIGIAGQLAIMRLALSSATVGGAIGHGFRRVLPAFLALILFGMAMAVIVVPLMILLVGPEGLDALRAGSPPPPGTAGVVLLIIALVVAVAARFQLILPSAAAESGGPIRLLKRSWQLSKGHYWRLLAFVLLSMVVAFIVVLFIGQVMGALLVRSMFGSAEPFSVGALAIGLIVGLAQAAFTVVISVMLARIYAQIAGGDSAEVSVPTSAA